MSRVQTSVLVLAVMMTVFAGTLLTARTAAAAPTDLGWGTPAPLTNHFRGDATSVGVAMDPNGNAVAGWVHQNGQRGLPSANYIPVGGAWQVPTVLTWGPDSATSLYRVSVAMDGAGNGIAVWSESWYVMASQYTPASGWGRAQQIGYCCTWSAEPMIAMNPAGDAFVVWYQWDGQQYSIFANHYIAGSGWTGTVWLESNNAGGAFAPRVGVDDTGNAIVVWYEWDGTSLYRIDSNRFAVGTGWAGPAYISPAGVYAYYPDIAVNRDGSAIAVYVDGNVAVRWIPYAPGPGWGAVGTLESTGFIYYTPRIATNAVSGDAIAAWVRYEAGAYNLYSSNFVASTTTWSPPFLREGQSAAVSAQVVAMNRLGRAVLAWQQSDGTVAQIYAWRYDPGTGWIGIYGLSGGLPGDKSGPAVAMSDFGTGVVAYQQKDGTRYSIRANRFTGSGFTGPAAVEFDDRGGTYYNRIAANDAGQAAVVWWQDDGPISNLYAATYHPATGWSPAAHVEFNDRGNAVDAQVAVDSAGNVFVIWVQWDAHWNIWSARWEAGTGWQTPYLMEAVDGDAGYPEIAFDASGNALATWYQWDGTFYRIYGASWSAGTWTAPVPVETGTGDAFEPHLAVAPDGRAVVAWHQYDGSYDSIYYATYSPGTGWATPALAESQSAWSRWVRIAMNHAGQAILIWHQWNGAAYDLWANRWDGSAWSGEQLIESEPGWVDWPVVAIDGRGNGIAAWYAWDGSDYNVYSVEYRNGAWQPARLRSPAAGDAFDPAVVADEPGNMMIAWTQWDGQEYGIQSQRYSADAGWTATAPMTETGMGASFPKLAADGAGDILAAFNRYNGESWYPWVNKYTIGDGAPRLDVASPTPGLTNNPSVVVSGSTDIGAKVTVDGAPVAVDATGGFVFPTTLPDGPHFFRIVATNLAGNSRTVTVAVTVDTTAPSLVISSPADGSLTNVLNAWVSGTTEPGATVDVDGIQATVDPSGRFGLTEGMAEGLNTFVVTATDAAGNSRSAVVRVTLDTVAPVLALAAPVNGMVTNNPNVDVVGSTDPGASVTVDGVSVAVSPSGTFARTVTLPEGGHTFQVVATDAAGNAATASASVTVDTTGPGVAITSPTNGALTNVPVISVFGTTEPGASVTLNGMSVFVDGGGNFFARITLAEGLQVIRADAMDPAGNVATTQVTVTLDTTPPELALGRPADGSITNDPNVLVSGISEPGSTVTVDGTSVTVSPSGTFSTTVPLPDGPHLFDVVATDPAGNVARTAASVTVDTVAPAVTITAPATGSTVTVPTVTVTGTSEPGSRVVVNGYAVSTDSNGAFSVRLALASGANAITATATDAAGNTATDSVSVTYNDPVPGLRQQLNDTNADLDATKGRLDATLATLGATQQTLNATRSDLATANANIASLGTETLILLVLVIVSIVLAAVQFLMLRRMRAGPTSPREPEAPPPST